jgi:zinc transporter 5/7
MASTYALPVSAMPHSRGHSHVHSHSHTPSFSPSKLGPGGQKAANTSRALRQERSNGSLHSHAYSESFNNYGNNQERAQNFEQLPTNADFPLQVLNNSLASGGVYREQRPYELPLAYSKSNSYEAGQEMASHTHRDHGDHDHSHHAHAHHDHTSHSHSHGAAEKRSRFTRTVLPYTEGWTLLHSILKEKDSRRIFYFMRCAS